MTQTRALVILLIAGLLAGACAKNETAGGAPAEDPVAGGAVAQPEPQPTSADVEPGEPSQVGGGVTSVDDAQKLYDECRERVEGRESPGECTKDEDCKAAGCSGEMCIPAAEAAGVMSGCEVRLCYQVLQSCGCQEGLCRWTVAPPPEGMGKKLPLPAGIEVE